MDIKAWINNPGRSYKDGLAIYHKVKRNKNKDPFLNAASDPAPDSLHFNMLLQEIKSSLRIMEASVQAAEVKPKPTGKPITTAPLKIGKKVAPPVTSGTPKFVYNELVDVKSLPEDLQQKYFQNQQITRELSGLHQQLRSAKSDKDRMILAENIEHLFAERLANWEAIDSFAGVDITASKPVEPVLLDASKDESPQLLAQKLLDAKKRLDTVKINISRVEKEVASGKLTHAKISARQSRLKVWQEEKLQLEQVLSGV